MSDFTNAAKRILSFVEIVRTKSEKSPASEVWAAAFDLDPMAARKDPHDVISNLGLLRAEIDLLEAAMNGTDYSEALYKPYLSQVRNAVTVSNISAPWANYRNNLTPDTILALKYCSEILPTEPIIDMEELEKILETISKFKSELENSNISTSTYDFVNSQLDIIERAIRNYPIRGGESIRQAFKDGFSDLSDRADDLQGQEDTDLTSSVGKVWKDLKTAGNEFVAADRIANAYISLIDKGRALSDGVLSLIQGGGSSNKAINSDILKRVSAALQHILKCRLLRRSGCRKIA